MHIQDRYVSGGTERLSPPFLFDHMIDMDRKELEEIKKLKEKIGRLEKLSNLLDDIDRKNLRTGCLHPSSKRTDYIG